MSLVPARRLVKRDVSYEFMNRQMVWHAFTEFLLFLLPLISARSVRRRFSRLTSHLNIPTSILSFVRSILGISSKMERQEETMSKRGKYWGLPRDQCAICVENASFSLNLSEPVNAFTSLTMASGASMDPSSDPMSEPPAHPLNTPYITSCGHVYCYHCLAEQVVRTADDGVDEGGWECLRCGEGVKGAERWIGDIVEERENGSDWGGDGFSSISDFESGTDFSTSSLGYSDPGLSE